MKSIRNLSNFNFQWPNPLYQNNNLKRIGFFFLQFFKGYRCKLVTRYNTKDISYGSQENEFKISQELWKHR